MKVYVCDPDLGAQRRHWAEMLGVGIKEVQAVAIDSGELQSASSAGISVVFIHSTTFTVRRVSTWENSNTNLVLICVSGGARPVEANDSARVYWRKAPVGKPEDQSFATCAQEFINAMRSICETGKALAFDEMPYKLLEPRSFEHECALRLLCEAWVMNDGKKESPHGSVVIHAPVTADDWFDPFVEGFKKLDSERKKQSANENSGKIADLMGNAKDDVRSFYDKLTKLYDGGVTDLTLGEFNDDIVGLVKKLNMALTT